MSNRACSKRKDSPREEWRICRSYPRYEVSSLGRVRDTQTGQLKTVSVSARCSERTAYATVNLNVCKGRNVNVYVHRLVAEAFLFMGPIPPGTNVCHKTDISSDNRACNLYIGTAADNARDCKTNGGRDRRRHAEIARVRAEGFARLRSEIAAANALIKPRPHAPPASPPGDTHAAARDERVCRPPLRAARPDRPNSCATLPRRSTVAGRGSRQ